MKKEKLLEMAVVLTAVLIQHDTEGARHPLLQMGRDRRAMIIQQEVKMLEKIAGEMGIPIHDHMLDPAWPPAKDVAPGVHEGIPFDQPKPGEKPIPAIAKDEPLPVTVKGPYIPKKQG